MYRRTGIALALLFLGLAAWMFSKDVTYERGKSIDFDEGTVESVMVYCGDVNSILWRGEFHEDIPDGATYIMGQCQMAARSHFAWILLFSIAGIVFLIIGLVRGKAPKVPAIDAVLKRLPTPAQMRGGIGNGH